MISRDARRDVHIMKNYAKPPPQVEKLPYSFSNSCAITADSERPETPVGCVCALGMESMGNSVY
jgi:hypothetical protein